MATQPVFKFDLGDLVKDKVSGYEGIVIVRSEWLNACRRYSIQAQALKDGKPIEAIGLDEDNMELVQAKKVADRAEKPTGGDQPMASRAADPTR